MPGRRKKGGVVNDTVPGAQQPGALAGVFRVNAIAMDSAVFAQDVAIRRYGERANNIVHWSEFDRGGHFAAMEAPDLLVKDVRDFYRSLR